MYPLPSSKNNFDDLALRPSNNLHRFYQLLYGAALLRVIFI
jgi:hypothetical protein